MAKRRRAADIKSAKLMIRLTLRNDDRLRRDIRRRGDVSKLVSQALDFCEDFMTLELFGAKDLSRDSPATSVTLSHALHKRLREAKVLRGVSMNLLVNSALTYWFRNRE